MGNSSNPVSMVAPHPSKYLRFNIISAHANAYQQTANNMYQRAEGSLKWTQWMFYQTLDPVIRYPTSKQLIFATDFTSVKMPLECTIWEYLDKRARVFS